MNGNKTHKFLENNIKKSLIGIQLKLLEYEIFLKSILPTEFDPKMSEDVFFQFSQPKCNISTSYFMMRLEFTPNLCQIAEENCKVSKEAANYLLKKLQIYYFIEHGY